MEESVAKKRLRKANYTNLEIKILLEEVALEKDVINSSLSNKITNKAKNAIWESIARKVRRLS